MPLLGRERAGQLTMETKISLAEKLLEATLDLRGSRRTGNDEE
jgi:hypothetical protein